jgi:hypothetical protein
MGKIRLEAVRPGMVLAGDVTERSGRVLLRRSTEITEKHLDILRKWGVSEVDLQGTTPEEEATSVQPDPAILQEAESRAGELFRHTDRGHPAVSELFRLCTLRLAQHSLRAGKHES